MDRTPDSYETVTAGAALKGAMFEAALASLAGMEELEHLDQAQRLRYTARISKALEATDLDEDDRVPVAKALDYGEVTTDVARLTQGGALVGQSLTPFRRRQAVAETLSMLEKGWRPWEAGSSVCTGPEMLVEFAKHLQDNFQAEDDEACELAEAVMLEFASRVAGG